MIDFNNQTALITGASGGIGRAITQLLHKLGAHVIITGSNLDKLEKLGQELESNYTIKVCDLSNELSYKELFSDLSSLDIMVCNAGITRDSLSMKMSDDNFHEVIKINLEANFKLNREAIKLMMKKRYGRIVNISSIVGVSGNIGQANYCASKAGLIGLTKSLALEVATRGITINTIAPGFIVSEMTSKLHDEHKEYLKQKIPTKAFGTPEDVANAVCFIASKNSSYITGQTIHVNGGMLMI